MWIRTYSKIIKGVKQEDIWRIWTDINNWPTWHDDLDYCKLEGAFVVGQHFFLKPKGVRPVKILISEINEGHSFTDCTSFLGAKMYDTHAIVNTPKGLELTNTLVVTGPLKWLWIKLVAQNVADSIPRETEALIKRAKDFHA